MAASRITLYSSAGTGQPNDCALQFSTDLPAGEYQLCLESFVCGAYTTPFGVTASGIFNTATWDNAVQSERVTLFVGPASNPVNVTANSIGFRLGPNLKSQTLRVRVLGPDGKALAAGFPAWVMQCVVIPV